MGVFMVAGLTVDGVTSHEHGAGQGASPVQRFTLILPVTLNLWELLEVTTVANAVGQVHRR
jgi:hypothetical protein